MTNSTKQVPEMTDVHVGWLDGVFENVTCDTRDELYTTIAALASGSLRTYDPATQVVADKAKLKKALDVFAPGEYERFCQWLDSEAVPSDD